MRQIADLVEKNGAASGRFESSYGAFVGAGKRATLVAEKFAVNQRRR